MNSKPARENSKPAQETYLRVKIVEKYGTLSFVRLAEDVEKVVRKWMPSPLASFEEISRQRIEAVISNRARTKWMRRAIAVVLDDKVENLFVCEGSSAR